MPKNLICNRPDRARPMPGGSGVAQTADAADNGTANVPCRSRRRLLGAAGSLLVAGTAGREALARESGSASLSSDAPALNGGSAADGRIRFGSGLIGIALFAPSATGIYGRAAGALIDGVRAARLRDGAGISVEVVEVDSDLIALRERYDELQQRGFSMVIGPLTRDVVSVIAAAGAPPLFTLALNQPDEGVIPPANMLTFGLSIEAEAAQAATVACTGAEAGRTTRPRAAVVRSRTPLDERSAEAFAERWRTCGGDIYEAIEVDVPSAGQLRTRLEGLGADLFFVAGDSTLARAVRVAMGPSVPVYGTSRLNAGMVPVDEATDGVTIGDSGSPGRSGLDGVRLIDLPWRVQPDASAVMAYTRAPDLNLELQKLYALGIDAFRIARLLIDRAPVIELDGVTGHLRLSPGGRSIERDGILAEYRDGVPVPIGLR